MTPDKCLVAYCTDEPVTGTAFCHADLARFREGGLVALADGTYAGRPPRLPEWRRRASFKRDLAAT